MSPLLFLLCFQPVITFANSLPYGGFRLQLPLPNSTGFQPIDSHIYVEWCEDGSSELPGWYHCRIVEYDADSLAVLIYCDGATESINLHSMKWEFARKNGKPYLPFSTAPPIYPLKKRREAATLPKYVLSASQKAKAYADDLTILSTSRSDHQLTLSSINGSCHDRSDQINVFHIALMARNHYLVYPFSYLKGVPQIFLLPLPSFSGKHWVSLQL